MWLEKRDIRIPACTHNVLLEISVRFLLLLLAYGIEKSFEPHTHHISEYNLLNHYKRPRRQSYVPGWATVFLVIVVPLMLFAVPVTVTKNYVDLTQAFLAWTLALAINAILTEMLKLVTGRPRPDFFYRCFPDGKWTAELICTGNARDVAEGRKSFPSGHSSFSFCSMGFVSFWLCGKLEIFSERPGCAARVLCCLAPLLAALVVGMSRCCDNHHHWQDVVVGALLGFGSSYVCYTQYYNPLESGLSAFPYAITKNRGKNTTSQTECCTKNLRLE